MKKMAARDFENLLQVCLSSDPRKANNSYAVTFLRQCAIPVFDGLLPEPHNRTILQLLFVAAHWHGLAKLRMHTDTTVKLVETVTTSFGDKLRAFSKKTCPAFNTQELRREFDARIRREAREAAARAIANPQAGLRTSLVNHVSRSSHPHSGPTQGLPTDTSAVAMDQARPAANSPPKSNKRRRKSLNLNTYKIHALGDYAATIRQYGTIDSYSTEPVRNTD
jgi:hypothetical protein